MRKDQLLFAERLPRTRLLAKGFSSLFFISFTFQLIIIPILQIQL